MRCKTDLKDETWTYAFSGCPTAHQSAEYITLREHYTLNLNQSTGVRTQPFKVIWCSLANNMGKI